MPAMLTLVERRGRVMRKDLVAPKSLPSLPMPNLKEMEGWGKLGAEEQAAVRTNTEGLLGAAWYERFSRVQQGRFAAKLQDILLERGMWVEFVRSVPYLRQKERSIYRYIAQWKWLEQHIPELAREAVITWDLDVRLVKAHMPPETTSPKEIAAWAAELKEKQKKAQYRRGKNDADDTDPRTLQEEIFRSFRLARRQLPRNPKAQTKWFEELLGYMMTEAGYSSPKSFSPIAVPEEFKTGPGRPKSGAA